MNFSNAFGCILTHAVVVDLVINIGSCEREREKNGIEKDAIKKTHQTRTPPIQTYQFHITQVFLLSFGLRRNCSI